MARRVCVVKRIRRAIVEMRPGRSVATVAPKLAETDAVIAPFPGGAWHWQADFRSRLEVPADPCDRVSTGVSDRPSGWTVDGHRQVAPGAFALLA